MTYFKNKMDLSLPSSGQMLFAAFFMFLMALPVLSMAGTVSLPQTGQTTCYDEDEKVVSCTDTGQDGDTLTGVEWPGPRFTDNGDSTVTDNLTGLVWTQNGFHPMLTKSWQEALDHVAGMNAGTYENLGYTDWRLPNINELESLVNVEESDIATWLSDQGFTQVLSTSIYWSSTSHPRATNRAWIVTMDLGHVTGYDKTESNYSWPVRTGSGGSFGNSDIWQTGQTTCYDEDGNVISCTDTGQDGDIQAGVAWPSPRFTDNGDSTVTDDLTGLVWAQDANLPRDSKTWQEALDYVAGMNAGTYENFGYTDWLLPNRKELFSLIDRSQHSPALPSGHPFTRLQAFNIYWCSTNYATATVSNAWVIDYYGGVRYTKKSYSYFVWPVREGSDVLNRADISISPASHDFGNVGMGDTSTAQSFTVSNNGDADLFIDTISIIGTDATEFSIQNDLCSGQTVAASGNCTVEAVFSPTVEAAVTANLSIPSNDTDTPILDVPLSGVGEVEAICTYSILPTSETFDFNNDTGSVSVTATSGCDWMATSNDTWITIDSGSSGTGDGTVDYSVSENTSTNSRAGTVTIADETFAVTQTGNIGEEISAPTGFTASASGDTLILSWNAVNGADGYYLYYGYSSGVYAGPVDLSNTINTSFSGIPDGTYYLAITAYTNSVESGYSGEESVTFGTTENLSAPTEFTASVSGDTLTLSWNAVSVAEGYYIYYGYSSGVYAGSGDLGNTTSASFNGVPAGTYYLALTSYADEEESVYSNEASVIINAQ